MSKPLPHPKNHNVAYGEAAQGHSMSIKAVHNLSRAVDLLEQVADQHDNINTHIAIANFLQELKK